MRSPRTPRRGAETRRLGPGAERDRGGRGSGGRTTAALTAAAHGARTGGASCGGAARADRCARAVLGPAARRLRASPGGAGAQRRAAGPCLRRRPKRSAAASPLRSHPALFACPHGCERLNQLNVR